MRLGIKFLLQIRIFRAAGARALRTAGLCHEAFDDAVKDHAIVESLADQLLDVLDMFRREVGTHLDDEWTLGRLERQCVSGIGHELYSPKNLAGRRYRDSRVHGNAERS